jgi:DNA-binding beta-propeller fold protein YncE
VWSGPSGSENANWISEVAPGRNAAPDRIKPIFGRCPANDIDDPVSIVVDGSRIWVANYLGSSIAEFNWNQTAHSYKCILSIMHAQGIDHPTSIKIVATRLWVLNSGDNTLTEYMLNGEGPIHPSVTLGQNRNQNALAWDMAVVRTNQLWVPLGTSLDVISLLTHKCRVIQNSKYSLRGAAEYIAVSGPHAWIVSPTNNLVSEINIATYASIRTMAGAHYGFRHPDGITVYYNRVWVTNRVGGNGGGSVSVFPAV